MPSPRAKLSVIYGKPAAGKSTLAAKLAQTEATVLVSEDAWLAALYSEQMTTLADYRHCSAQLRQVMGPHVTELLSAGVSVVMDYPANTKDMRAWMAGLAEAAGVVAELHVLDLSDAECKARLARRNASGTHPFQLSDTQFDQVIKYLSSPDESEAFDIIHHDVAT